MLVVKSAEAASNPQLASIDLGVTTEGLDLGIDASGGLAATDASVGGKVFEAPQPVMWDSSGAAQPAARKSAAAAAVNGPGEGSNVGDVDLDLADGKLTLTPDADLLKGPDTTYPVVIDPVNKTYTRTGWTWVSSHHSGLEGWKFSNDESEGLPGKGLGRCPADVSARCASSNDVQRQFYALPTGALEGKNIVKAEFTITLVHTYNSTARGVQLHRVNSSGGSAISSRTNWSNQPSSKDYLTTKEPTNTTGSCTSKNQNVRFGVTGTIRTAASKGWDRTTFGLRASSEGSYASWKRFCNNAALEVEYNRPPYQPKMSELTMSPGGECTYGEAEEHYADEVPTLSAVVWDPDHGDAGGSTEQLRAQFEVFWTNTDGTEESHTVTTDYKQSNSSSDRPHSGYERFRWTVGDDIPGDGTGSFTIPENVVIGWWVRGGDKNAWGPWSHAGSATRCQFLYDATAPEAPAVTSTEYPDDDTWHRGVGDYGTFSFHTPGTDIASYRYQFTGESWKTATPPEPGRPATVRWMPRTDAAYHLIVQAVDTAGNTRQTPNAHTFLVDAGRPPVGSWALADAEGSTQAAGEDGAEPAEAGTGVTFGVDGPHGSVRTAARLDGTAEGYLDTGQHLVDTDQTFSVGAWVKLPEVPTSSMALVSQDGSAYSGFTLGFDGDSGRWSFLAPDLEIGTMISWEVLGPRPVAGEWTHLVGVYDRDDGADPGSMRMYVNGHLVEGDIQERATTWNATGDLQIGRALEPRGYTDHLKGTVADVAVFDRVLTEAETAGLGGLPPGQLAYWNMDQAADTVIPELGGGTGLDLHGDASVYLPDETCDPGTDPTCQPVAQPLWGDGHLDLSGADGYVSRGPGLLASKASFTITARARLTSPDATEDQTVLALPGSSRAAALVRYDADRAIWELEVTESDTAGAPSASVPATGSEPSAVEAGDHLALVHDALFARVQLYVNGELAAEVSDWRYDWDFSAAALHIGRAGVGPTGTEHFSGALDEVRVFEGAFDQHLAAAVSMLQSGENLGTEVT
ncbi:LamG domain-containing protein [Streptomyces sp. RKND-216]|uniref:LamG domain-containing protein n=1 Tax=Streptomyces sp. RKND-216 TaxID=2562581 RepID=UPI001FF9F299|nr:LamG domain-containing protein [Streptomyces sp. RKND-216]